MILQNPPSAHPRRTATVQGGVIFAAAVLAIIIGVVAKMSIEKDYRSEAQDIFSTIERITQKLASRTTEVFDRVDQTLSMVEYLSRNEQAPHLKALREAGLLAEEMIRDVALIDANGRVLDASGEGVGLDFSQDAGFRRLMSRNLRDIDIGLTAPTPLAGGAAMIPVMRRLNHPGGVFAGVVLAMVDPATLSSQNQKLEAEGTAIGVVGLDGMGRMRLSNEKITYGAKVDIPLIMSRARMVRESLQPAISAVDNRPRFVTNVPVERYPMLAVIAVDAHAALADYRRARDQTLAWAVIVTGMIFSGAALLWRRAREIETSRDRTLRAESALRATLEGSMDAVSVLRARRLPDGTLEDMLIADTNARAAGLHGGTREGVLGRGLCELRPSVRREGFLARFDEVMRSGEPAEIEIQAVDGLLRGRWLHHQMVPLDDGIALITRDVTDRREAARALASLARTDPLTQLGNRRDFDQRLAEARARAQRSGHALALVCIDLDGFKGVNDSFGHAVGDRVLIGVAQRLLACVRATDTVSRLGGDEFAIVLENPGGNREVRELCARVLLSLARPHAINGRELLCTPSIGAALLRPRETLAELAERADAAMYDAKQSGKRSYRVDTEFEPTGPGLLGHDALGSDLGGGDAMLS